MVRKKRICLHDCSDRYFSSDHKVSQGKIGDEAEDFFIVYSYKSSNFLL